MRIRRHLAPPLFRTIRGRRGLKQAGIVVAGFVVGYLITVIWLFPAPLFSSDHPVPRVLDEDGAEARHRLDQQGFRTRMQDDEPHPTAPRGAVIWQDPAPGTVLPAGSTVLLTASAGPAPVAVPDVVGIDESQARKIIEAAGLKPGAADSVPAGSDPGVVVATRPATGVGRDPGSTVDLVVSSGPAEINVPDVIGMSPQQARERLSQAGLQAGEVVARTVTSGPAGVVIEQRPASGTLSSRKARVNLFISRKPNP